MRNIIIALALFLSVPVFAKNRENLKFINLIENTFEKPVVISSSDRAKGKKFNYKSFQKKETNQGKKNYISNYLKLQNMNMIEIKDEVHIVPSRDATKMNIPVFNEKIPEDIREQIIVLIKTVPKKLKAKDVSLTLRSHYSREGDLRIDKKGQKIIIADWSSNILKMIKIIEAM